VTITVLTPFMPSIVAVAVPSELGTKSAFAETTCLPRCTHACRTLPAGSWCRLARRSVPVSPSRTISAVTPGEAR